ncbi:MAG: hypothetical protein RPU64_15920 [Candidatus Sedimenticola sp. (ex Thyasira tokunagai)]
MSAKMMILPSTNPEEIRLVTLPDDMDSHEAFRHVTGLIAALEDQGAKPDWEDVGDALEDHGFQTVEFVLGPSVE